MATDEELTVRWVKLVNRANARTNAGGALTYTRVAVEGQPVGVMQAWVQKPSGGSFPLKGDTTEEELVAFLSGGGA